MAPDGQSARVGPGRWLVPSLGSILGLVALINAFLFAGRRFFASDGDVGRHIRVGRTILDGGMIPNTDLYSHTRHGTQFVPYEWLSETVTALADMALGLPGVVVLSALLYVVAVLAVYRTANELGSRRITGFLVAALALLLQSVHLLPRPHLVTTAFAAIFVLVLVRFAKTGLGWRLAPLPLLMLVWVNSHGGFLVGFLLLAIFLGGAVLQSEEFASPRQAILPLVVTIAVCAAASLLNPAGPSTWAHTTGYLRIDFLVDVTQEYRSVDFHVGYGKLFFFCLFAGPAAWMTGRVRVSPLAAGLYLLFAAMALHSARNIPLFSVAAMPWLAVWIHRALDGRGAWTAGVLQRLEGWEGIDRQLRPGLAFAVAVGLIWFAIGPNAGSYRFDPEVFPVAAVASLGPETRDRPVFNQLFWGGYLLYAKPDVPVFIDGQTDFYGEELSREYLAAVKGNVGWRSVLDRYGIGWTLLGVAEPLNQLLELDPEWHRIYADDVAIIFVRRERN